MPCHEISTILEVYYSFGITPICTCSYIGTKSSFVPQFYKSTICKIFALKYTKRMKTTVTMPINVCVVWWLLLSHGPLAERAFVTLFWKHFSMFEVVI